VEGDSDKVPVDIWLPLLNKSHWVEDGNASTLHPTCT
jgi:hypothetical protein